MPRELIKRLLTYTSTRYLLVGIGAVCIDIFFYYVLIHFTSVSPSSAKRMSFITGGIWSYRNNKKFTFRVTNSNWYAPIIFSIVYLIGFYLNSLVHDYLFTTTFNKLLAVLTATFVSVVWNYIGQKFFVFKNPTTHHD
jgi:putative flippase GtrA